MRIDTFIIDFYWRSAESRVLGEGKASLRSGRKEAAEHTAPSIAAATPPCTRLLWIWGLGSSSLLTPTIGIYRRILRVYKDNGRENGNYYTTVYCGKY